MSSLNPPYTTYIYQQSSPLTWEWLNNLLRQLWMRGITFSLKPSPRASWEEELQTPEFEVQGSSTLTLGDALKESLVRGSLYLTIWDGGLEYKLSIDPDNAGERRELENASDDPEDKEEWEDEIKRREDVGRIILYCDMSRQDRLYGEKLMQVKQLPYLRAYHGHLHWSQVLCEILNPLFALGDIGSQLPEEEHFRIWEQLARDEVPDVASCLRKKACCYLPAKDLTIELLTKILTIPNCSFQRLSNGSTFLSVTPPRFHYEGNTAQLEFLLGRDLLSLEYAEDRPLTDEAIKEREEYLQQALQEEDLDEVKRHFQRALTIYSTIKDISGVNKTESALRWLEEQIQEKQHQH